MSDSPKRLLFDECIGKPVMLQLLPLVSPGLEVHHLVDKFARGEKDEDWDREREDEAQPEGGIAPRLKGAGIGHRAEERPHERPTATGAHGRRCRERRG